ncbi:YML083C domain-containing protein [Prosthecobacter vanneervenii]|uniref:Protein kinase domain-containing protein n=1 Tax=Prosthecobacter vanneervenii TaxID=48466 RepID=A0A7W7YCG8_9BACT|nr:hypothetical protein [Prosthecobacter vanneervenii]MBB5033628.1 hypothetical protein [Prosthecobacter vanneervenii]
MSEPSLFRHYQIVQDADGNNVELVRNSEQVAVLAFDTQRLEYVHCHVLLEPLANRAAFEEISRSLQKRGHPTLARMVEFGEDEGNPFYITSSIDGETLRSYLARQQDLPGWLAIMIATRAVETAVALCERGELITDVPLESLRIVQTAPQTVQVLAADFRIIDSSAGKKRALKTSFEKQAKFLRTFLVEQGGTLPDHMLPAADYAELLGSCLASAGVGVIAAMRELRASLQKLAPENLSGEIPAPQKPRALLAPLLAGYQEVARGLVNLVRIQSQRLDMANPYSMRGTLTKTGRAVLIEQVPPKRVAHSRVKEADDAALKAGKQRDCSSLITLALVNESDDITCMAEEVAEGISLADLIRERHRLDVHEAYLVLAGLDTALTQLDNSALPVSKLRLEDIFLLTGFAREDTRSTKLLVSRLNEWPAFNIMVRAHPTLASMSGRGTDPAVLLPLQSGSAGGTVWHASWLSALAKFLLGFESPPGTIQEPEAGGARERETIARLLDDEIAKMSEAKPAKRSDFLARYARIIQHYDLAKPVEPSAPVRSATTDPLAGLGLKPAPKTVPVTKPAPKREPIAISATEPLRSPVALTTGGAARGAEEPTIGFAELLFRHGGAEPSPPDAPDWARAAASAPPTLPEHLIPRENVPIWLKAAVFLSGSMVLGAMCAHLSGSALWQKKQHSAPVEAAQPLKAPAAAPAKSGKTTAVSAPPKAGVVDMPAPQTAPVAPQPEVPKAIPLVAPPEGVPPSGGGVTLSLPPGATGLRDQLAPAAASPAPPRP